MDFNDFIKYLYKFTQNFSFNNSNHSTYYTTKTPLFLTKTPQFPSKILSILPLYHQNFPISFKFPPFYHLTTKKLPLFCKKKFNTSKNARWTLLNVKRLFLWKSQQHKTSHCFIVLLVWEHHRTTIIVRQRPIFVWF